MIVLRLLMQLEHGTHFQFQGEDQVYIARGNGWYSSENGYDGGPWASMDMMLMVNVLP